MDRKTLTAFGISTLVLVLLGVVLVLTPPARIVRGAGVGDALPTDVQSWQGHAVWYCQNAQCTRSFEEAELEAGQNCPECDSVLDRVALAEKTLLPAGTRITKRRYTSTMGDQYAVSIVLAGEERRSIHKPQRCLKGQGFAIVDKRVLKVPLGDGDTLNVMVLDLKPQGRNPTPPASYAFWFSTTNVRTPFNWERVLRVAQDRIFLNRVPEWAYVGVMTRRYPGSDAHLRRLERFLGSLYPLIREDKETTAPQ